MIYRSRKLIKPEDLNAGNTLFGGRLIEWIDEEAAIYAMCQLGTTNIVTKIISEVNFVAPAKQKDIIEIGVQATLFKTTSISLHVIVRNKMTGTVICEIENMVFVSVDEQGKKVAHGKTMPISEDVIPGQEEKIKVNEYNYVVTTNKPNEGDLCISFDVLNYNSLPENLGKLKPFICKWSYSKNCNSCRKIIETDNPKIKC